MPKVLIPLEGNEVASRFDLCTEVWLGDAAASNSCIDQGRIMVLSHASAEDLCQLILSEGVEIVICGAIEREYFDYLRWKKVKIYDSVIGSYPDALKALISRRLESGSILNKNMHC